MIVTLLELKRKGCKIVFSFLSDPCYDESLEGTKHWWEELDPIIIGGTPTSKFGYQFDYFIESTINYLDKAFGKKNVLNYLSKSMMSLKRCPLTRSTVLVRIGIRQLTYPTAFLLENIFYHFTK